MGTKRHHDDDAHAGTEASSKRQRSFLGKKRKAQDDSGAKKRARAIERALRRNEKLPADVRSNLERELASQKAIAEDKAYRKKRSAMISRYHMVRFFERKKASRLAKQLKRRMEHETDAAELDKLRRFLHIAEVDEAYTQYFPHLEAYVGLYSASAKSKHEGEAGKDDDDDDDDDNNNNKESSKDDGKDDAEAVARAALEAERPPMWSAVEIAMKKGPAALERLRDRRSPTDSGESGFVFSSRPPARPRPAASTREQPTPAWKKNQNKNSNEKAGGEEEEKEARHTRHNKPARDTSGHPSGEKTKETKGKEGNKQPEMNRRERRRLMREAAEASKDADGDEDEAGGGFFEGL